MSSFKSFIIIGLALALLGLSAEAEREQWGSLVKVRGEVQIRKSGTDRWTTAHERMGVGRGDRIKTGADGEATIRLSPRNTISVRPNSEMGITSATVRTEGTGFGRRSTVQKIETDLTRGRAVNVLRGLGRNSEFSMRTPVAVAGVRGTVFMVGVTDDGKAEFSCIEGSVQITPIAGATEPFEPTTINAGQFVAVEPVTADAATSSDPTVEPVSATTTLEIQTIESSSTTSSGDETTTTSTQQETSSTETTSTTTSTSTTTTTTTSPEICF